MTESQNAFFKPSLQQQTVSMIEKQAGFLNMIGEFRKSLKRNKTFSDYFSNNIMITIKVNLYLCFMLHLCSIVIKFSNLSHLF